jgi:chromosome segregation ATPase
MTAPIPTAPVTDQPEHADETPPTTATTVQQIAAAEAHLADIEQRLAELRDRAPARAETAERRASERQQAVVRVDTTAQGVATLHDRLNTSRARLLIASEDAVVAAAIQSDAQSITRALSDQQEVLEAAERALADLVAQHDAAATTDAQEAQQDAAEIASLEPLVPALATELARLNQQRGEELLATLTEARTLLDERRAAAQRELVEADAALADFERRAGMALSPYPAAHAEALRSPVLPRHVTRIERLIASRLEFLAVLSAVIAEGGPEASTIGDHAVTWALVDHLGPIAQVVERRSTNDYLSRRRQDLELMLSQWRQTLARQQSR